VRKKKRIQRKEELRKSSIGLTKLDKSDWRCDGSGLSGGGDGESICCWAKGNCSHKNIDTTTPKQKISTAKEDLKGKGQFQC
jgi:hypothetical protein